MLRAIGDALMGVESFQASQKYYWFKLENGDEPFLSFVAHLPDTYARNGKFVGAAGGRDASSRRVTFSLAAGEDGEKDLVLRQNPILMDMDQDEEKYPLVLARNVKEFTIEWWGTNNLNHAEWMTDWDDKMTNTIPAMVRVHLVLGANVAGGSSRAGVRRHAHLCRALGDDAGARATRRRGRTGRTSRFASAARCSARWQPRFVFRSAGWKSESQPEPEAAAMKIIGVQKERGFAVIIALIAVTILTLLAGAFAYSMKIETRLAANTNDDEQFYWVGRGGVERACWWLAQEGNQPFSSKQQYWDGGPGDGPETNSPLAGESLDNFPLAGGTVPLNITELESKININSADGPLLKQALTSLGADANDISVVSDSILDWIDPDDNTRPAGAESDYYLGLVPSYSAKNAPIDSCEELLSCQRRHPRHVLRRSSAAANPPLPEHHLGFGHAPGQQPDYTFGLKDVFTPFSIPAD